MNADSDTLAGNHLDAELLEGMGICILHTKYENTCRASHNLDIALHYCHLICSKSHHSRHSSDNSNCHVAEGADKTTAVAESQNAVLGYSSASAGNHSLCERLVKGEAADNHRMTFAAGSDTHDGNHLAAAAAGSDTLDC